MTQLAFTRYLYIKDEVELSLVTSLLTHNKRCLFWAFELYYSGYKTELFALLWKIYYDFFASLHPNFWEYMAKQEKEADEAKAIACIVQNLHIRECNLDGFLVRQNLTKNPLDIPKEPETLEKWMQEKEINLISNYIMKWCPLNNLQTVLNRVVTFFRCTPVKVETAKKKWAKAIHCSSIDPRTHLLSIILAKLTKSIKQTRLFIEVLQDEIDLYKTVEINPENDKARKILPRVLTYSIDEDDYLSLFALARNSIGVPLTNIYYYHWEYYASRSPVWAERLAKYKGSPIDETQLVVFKEDSSGSDDNQEAFYCRFGYEPDEQSKEVQRKNIQYIQHLRSWDQVYLLFKEGSIYCPDSLDSWSVLLY